MAKALKIVGTVVAVVALAATGIGLALAPGAFALGLGTAGMLAVGTYAGLAAGLIGLATAVFAPKPSFSTGGNPQQFQTNPQSGLPYPIGRTRMSGVRIHADTYDAPSFKSESKQDILSFAVLFGAGGPMEEIETFRADKEAVTFDPSTGNAIGGFSNFMAQKVSLGIAGASALALAFGGGNFPGWSSAHKLSGISHALWDLRYDSKGEKFGAGVPEPEWIGKWVMAYDPRKDSTFPGGSGSHRALDETTYEWTRNPALHGLTWALGRWQNGKRTVGMGAPIANIRVADFVEAANISDANDWYCGGVEWSTDSKWATLKRMLQAGGAEPTMTGAMIGCRVNTPRISIATVTGADLLDGLSIAATRSRRDRFNTAIPRYRSEDHEWEVISGTPVSVPDYVTQDGGVRTKEIDLPLVQAENVGDGDGNVQAGQLVAYEIVNSREAGPWRFSTGPKFLGIKSGDCITLDVPDEGIDEQPVIVREVSRDPATLQFTFVVETETDEKHAFALGSSTTPPPTWSPTPPDLTPPTPTAALWLLNNAYSDDGHPGILIAGACEFPGADSVLIEYRKVGDPDWITIGKIDAAQPVRMVVAPLDGETDFEARVAYQSENRFSDWLNLSSVETPPAKLAGIDDGATRNVIRGDWAPSVAYEVNDIVTYGGSSYSVTTAHTSSGGSPPPNANVTLLAQAGLNTATVMLYQRNDSSSPPAVPGTTLTYTFLTSALTGTLAGWTQADPGIGSGSNRWEIRAFPTSTTATASILTGNWSTPAITLAETLSNSGLTVTSTGVPAAADGTVSPTNLAALGSQFVVKRDQTNITSDAAVSFSVVSEPDGDISINTATNTPVSGKPKGWVTVHSLTADIATFVVRATLGTKTIDATYRVTKDRAIPGDTVLNGHIFLYRRTTTNSAPAVPDNDITLTFATGALTGSLDGWSANEPNVSAGAWLWSTGQYYSSTAATATLTPAGWGTPYMERHDDIRAWVAPFGRTIPANADGTVDAGYFAGLDGQLYLQANATLLLGEAVDAGVTVAEVSEVGCTGTINTATNTPVSGKPKGYVKINALDAGVLEAVYTVKVTKDGIDYPATITITKAIKGENAENLTIKKSRDAITYNGQGLIWPASQSIAFTAIRHNLPSGTVTFEVRDGANNLKTPLATYGTVVGDVLTMTETQFELARGNTQTVQVRAYIGGVEDFATVSGTPLLNSGDNEWPDPLLNTLDRNFSGGALTAPFSMQTNGISSGYKYANYLRVVSTTSPTTEYFAPVATKIPVRSVGEKFWLGFTGGVGTGSGALMFGIYAKFFDIDGVQQGATATVGTSVGMTLANDWPQVNGAPITAPANAAYVEIGWWRDDHGIITSSQAQAVAPYFQRSQPSADQTRDAFPDIAPVMVEPSGTVILNADWKGLGLPTTLRFKFSRSFGGVDVSSSTTWTMVKSIGCNASVNSSGLVTVTPAVSTFDPAGFQFRLESTYDGVTEDKVIRGQVEFAPPPQPSAASTIAVGALESFDLTATSYASETVIAGPMTIDSMTGGTIAGRVAWIVTADAYGAGSAGFNFKAQYRLASGGSWTDASSTVVVVPPEDSENFDLRGAALSFGASGLTNSTDYEFRVIAYKTTAGHIYGQPKRFTLNSGVLL